MEILNLRVKERIVNLAGMAEADIGEHLVKGPQGDVSVCTGEVPRADICDVKVDRGQQLVLQRRDFRGDQCVVQRLAGKDDRSRAQRPHQDPEDDIRRLSSEAVTGREQGVNIRVIRRP